VMASPVLIGTCICNSGDTSQTLAIQRAIDYFSNCRARATSERIRADNLTPHRCQKNKVMREAEILLRDLQLRHHLRVRHRAEEWMERLTRLKVYWSIFHLKQHVRRKLSIEWLKILVGRSCAVVTGLRVVDKGTPH